jgi:gamma-glutamylputrescine oxidase
MAGLSCAQTLVAAGKKVAIVEREFCGAGASGKAAGFILQDSELELGELIRTRGVDDAKKIWEFVGTGVERIRNNIQENHFDCDYQKEDSMFVANNQASKHFVYEERESRSKLGYSFEVYEQPELRRAINSPRYTAGIRYTGTFGIDPFAYCQEFSEMLQKQGVRIFENTAVQQIEKDHVTTASGTVFAKNIVVCADRFIPEFGKLQSEIYHIQTFVGVTTSLTAEQVKLLFPSGNLLVWDTDLIYHYFRVTGENKLLLGWADVTYTYSPSPAKHYGRFPPHLRAYFAKTFPQFPIEWERIWPGMLGVTKDLLPIMGPDEIYDSIWYAGAATGLPWATALGVYSAERILNGRNDFDEVFSSKRTFTIGPRVQKMLTKPLSFALSHALIKYL